MNSLSAVPVVLVWACVVQAADPYQPGASGVDVTKAAAKLVAEVFPVAQTFLLRVAQAESRCGDDPGTYRTNYHGGIWQVDKVGFEATLDVNAHRGLTAKWKKIKDHFGIDWTRTNWYDLRKPFYSALAARLFLSNIAAAIPTDMQGQAVYWKQYYNTPAGGGTVNDFINRNLARHM